MHIIIKKGNNIKKKKLDVSKGQRRPHYFGQMESQMELVTNRSNAKCPSIHGRGIVKP